MSSTQPTLMEAGTKGEEAVVVVHGRGTFQVAQPLKAFGLQAVDSGVRHLCIDLAECPTVDSTFVGVLALIGRLGRRSAMRVQLLRTGEKAMKQIRGLGIAGMFDFQDRDPPPAPLQRITGNVHQQPADIARTALQAHEELVSENPPNEPVFKGVIKGLREDLDRLGGE
jgi:anti-anti-sigma regulatory factor